jgi:hypothetical protein
MAEKAKREYPEFNTNHKTCCGACIKRLYCDERKYFCEYYPVVPNQHCGEMDQCDHCSDFQKIKGIDSAKAKRLMAVMMKEMQEYYAQRWPKDPDKITKKEALAIVDDVHAFLMKEDVRYPAYLRNDIKKLRRFVQYSDIFGY